MHIITKSVRSAVGRAFQTQVGLWYRRPESQLALADSRHSAVPIGSPLVDGSAAPFLCLTPRQREITDLVAKGRTNRQIGEALVITEGTARVHVEHTLTRLELHSRAQLAGWAVAHGLVTAPA